VSCILLEKKSREKRKIGEESEPEEAVYLSSVKECEKGKCQGKVATKREKHAFLARLAAGGGLGQQKKRGKGKGGRKKEE